MSKKVCTHYQVIDGLAQGAFYFVLDNGMEYKLYNELDVLIDRTQLYPKRFLIKKHNLKFIPKGLRK